jgi:hypothetical protein
LFSTFKSLFIVTAGVNVIPELSLLSMVVPLIVIASTTTPPVPLGVIIMSSLGENEEAEPETYDELTTK